MSLPNLIVRLVYGRWMVCGAGGAVHRAVVAGLLLGGTVNGAVVVRLLWVALVEGRARCTAP
jgi:hypothetical protein